MKRNVKIILNLVFMCLGFISSLVSILMFLVTILLVHQGNYNTAFFSTIIMIVFFANALILIRNDFLEEDYSYEEWLEYRITELERNLDIVERITRYNYKSIKK